MIDYTNCVGTIPRIHFHSQSALGAKVIAAAGSQEKMDVSFKYGGADHVINYTKKGWQDEVKKQTDGKGVDVVYDPVGLIKGRIDSKPINQHGSESYSQDSLKCIAWKGRALVVGFAGGQFEKVYASRSIKLWF